ncbi:hypothetical protein VNO78_28668 [Psophocarpus tetragonolobus]|uniref:TLC domain-containing protein n=1 Tax=Psophocarpus tetragonolobus TaxID=3891 RepID=A0AAN9RTL1_PSOTE
MEDYIIKTIFIGVVSWTIAFVLVRRILPKRSFDFCNRVVSTLHATLAVTLAWFSVEDWSCPICPVGSKSSPQQMQVLAVSLSYLIYDLACCHLGERVYLDNTVHHLVSIIGIGAEMVATVWITEISSPFLHLRELLKELGYRDTLVNLAADDGGRTASHLRNFISQLSTSHKGYGIGFAAGKCILVLQDCENDKTQINQEINIKNCLTAAFDWIMHLGNMNFEH